ncbi:hypothetical protein DdX_18018 [Ditylenchus destructor]|uniref:Uncharacterized protein n=1 Tax=Ditylenchus destructor TaxID=166010 RepID=A0AAD4MKP2_9BILA|nr:hypothetical protein DdX_18018 [Ditylenchus destructor]
MKSLSVIFFLVALVIAGEGKGAFICDYDSECDEGQYCQNWEKSQNSCEQLPHDCDGNEDCPSGFVCRILPIMMGRCVTLQQHKNLDPFSPPREDKKIFMYSPFSVEKSCVEKLRRNSVVIYAYGPS